MAQDFRLGRGIDEKLAALASVNLTDMMVNTDFAYGQLSAEDEEMIELDESGLDLELVDIDELLSDPAFDAPLVEDPFSPTE